MSTLRLINGILCIMYNTYVVNYNLWQPLCLCCFYYTALIAHTRLWIYYIVLYRVVYWQRPLLIYIGKVGMFRLCWGIGSDRTFGYTCRTMTSVWYTGYTFFGLLLSVMKLIDEKIMIKRFNCMFSRLERMHGPRELFQARDTSILRLYKRMKLVSFAPVSKYTRLCWAQHGQKKETATK